MIELSRILEGLVQRTDEGRLKWVRSVQDNQFVAAVDTISVMIVENRGFGGGSYRLDVFDERGDIVDSLGRQDTTAEQDRLLGRLFVLARRSAMDVDSTLQKLAEALEL